MFLLKIKKLKCILIPLACSILFIVFSICSAYTQEVPAYPVSPEPYITEGFSRILTRNYPPSGEQWDRLSSSLTLPLYTAGSVHDEGGVVEYTVLTAFYFDIYKIENRSLLLVVPSIGENWEIYINGYRLESHIYYDGISLSRRIQYVDHTVEIPVNRIRDGFNVVAFRLIGKRGSPFFDIGFQKGDFSIQYYSDYFTSNQPYRIILIILLTLIVSISLFLFISFITNRENRLFFLYSLLGLSIAAVHPFIQQYISGCNTEIVYYYQIILIPLSAAVLSGIFVLTLFNKVNRKGFIIIGTVYILLVCAQVVLFRSQFYTIIAAILMQGVILSGLIAGIKKHKKTHGSVSAITVTNIVITEFFVIYYCAAFFVQNDWIYFSLVYVISISLCAGMRFIHEFHALKEEEKLQLSRVDILKRNSDLEDKISTLHKDIGKKDEMFNSVYSNLIELQKTHAYDMQIASIVQQYIFPAKPPQCNDYEIGLYSSPAYTVSGDMYDFYVEKGGLEGISLFESTSQGISPGLIAILARSIIYRRFTQFSKRKLSYIFEMINSDISTEIHGKSLYLAGQIIKCKGSSIEYINAGHTDMIYRNAATGNVRLVVPRGKQFKSGRLGDTEEKPDFSMLSFTVHKNDLLILFSDGYEKCENLSQKRYGIQKITEAVQNIPEKLDANGIVDYLVKTLNNFSGNAQQKDDITIIAVRKL